MNDYKYYMSKISKGDEYKVNAETLMNFITSTGIKFFQDFDVEIKKFSETEWIIKILNENNDWEEVKINEFNR